MDATYPPLSVPASPDYFLALFRLDEELEDLTHTDRLVLISGRGESARRRTRDWLATQFGVVAADFDREFPTLRRRTVGELCRFLAERAPRPAVRPWLNDCAAGAFLTIRYHLVVAGADVSEVRPSAALEPLLRTHPRVFNYDLQLIAPGLPLIDRYRPVVMWAGAGFVVSALLSMLASWLAGRLGDPPIVCLLAQVGTILSGGCLAVAVVAMLFPPRRVTLGDLITFRDLARAVAVQQPV